MEMGVTTRRVELTFAHVKIGRQLREFGIDEPERQEAAGSLSGWRDQPALRRHAHIEAMAFCHSMSAVLVLTASARSQIASHASVRASSISARLESLDVSLI
jgi:hypothetical protein